MSSCLSPSGIRPGGRCRPGGRYLSPFVPVWGVSPFGVLGGSGGIVRLRPGRYTGIFPLLAAAAHGAVAPLPILASRRVMADLVDDPTKYLARFGLADFRPGQREVIDTVLSGRDTLCVMPTGGGKSLCYQLPSLARSGTTIVVSPLIALMKDQIDTLRRRGIHARLLNSSQSARERDEVMRELASGSVPMVYVAPERLRNGRFLEALGSANVTLLAVDEAHCVSEWGHDFRPDYLRLGKFRERYLGGVQTIALTATATPTVRNDICDLLGLESPAIFVTGFARTNLHFAVSHCGGDREKDAWLETYLSDRSGGAGESGGHESDSAGGSAAGIVYAATRKRCEELGEWLPEKTGRRVGVYHAGLHPDERRRVHEAFMSGELSVIVATNAFGMGIDKANIRFVVHYNMPGSLEAYYQEAGRAGRDGEPSDCVLLFSYHDRYVQEFFIENRYPSRETVRKVYQYLLSRPEDPIELTLDQVREAIAVKDGSEAVGTAETLLGRAGVLKRLDSNANQAIVRIDSDCPTMLDFLPKEAKLRRKVMAAAETVIGKRRGEDVFVRPPRLAELAGVDRDQLTRTLRELQRLRAFDYVPPFRGRAVHFLQRDIPFERLEIDFDELARRKRAEYEKLEAVIGFARSAGCRQRKILDYFGDTDSHDCGLCDRCGGTEDDVEAGRGPLAESGGGSAAQQAAGRPAAQGVDSDDLLRGIRVVLSGVARMHGRFGKQLVAQMLCGSKNKKLQQWKLHRLSTYGLLAVLKQSEVSDAIDVLVQCGLIEQREVDQRRPTVHLTELGDAVMRGTEPLPGAVEFRFPLAKRLAAAARSVGGGTSPAPAAETAGWSDGAGRGSPEADELRDRLRRFRRKRSAALGVPPYRVLTNATIDRLVEAPPQTVSELEAMPGVGPSTVEAFGHDLLELIAETCGLTEPDTAARGAARPVVTGPSGETLASDPLEACRPGDDAAAAPDSPPSAAGGIVGGNGAMNDACWTWRLFRDGYTADQVCQIRRSDRRGVDEDLLAAALAGRPVEPRWAEAAETRRRLEEIRATGV